MEENKLHGDTFVLPEKWCIKSTSTRNNVGRWFNEHRECSITDYFTGDYIGYYFHYPVIKGGSYGSDYSFDVNAQRSVMIGYTEITYEQFIKYVLKQEVKVMETYRIKTKEEFIAEFGDNFKDRIQNGWASSGNMDYLFGAEITKKDYNYIISKGSLSKNWSANGKTGSWAISKDMITNKPLNNKSNMKQNFAISGTEVLKEAFIKASGVKPYSSSTFRIYKYLTGGSSTALSGTGDSGGLKRFNLPEDWNAALAYVKDYFTPVITEKKVKFADLTLTIKSGDNFATSSHGKITKAQVERVLSMFDKKIDICGYELEIEGVDGIELKFGCQVGTVGQAKNLLKAFNE